LRLSNWLISFSVTSLKSRPIVVSTGVIKSMVFSVL
jgi:hypothetical protein